MNPHVAPTSYVDDYTIASLVLELTACVLATLRRHANAITPEMILGSATHQSTAASSAPPSSSSPSSSEESMRLAVEKEERAFNGAEKKHTSGGGGGYGLLLVASHSGVQTFGSATKEGVHDAQTDVHLAEAERAAEQRIAKRIAAHAAAAAAGAGSSSSLGGKHGSPYDPATILAAGALTAPPYSPR